MILVPVGLLAAFLGLVRNEEPRKYCIIGFVLNMLWFLMPIVAICGGGLF